MERSASARPAAVDGAAGADAPGPMAVGEPGPIGREFLDDCDPARSPGPRLAYATRQRCARPRPGSVALGHCAAALFGGRGESRACTVRLLAGANSAFFSGY